MRNFENSTSESVSYPIYRCYHVCEPVQCSQTQDKSRGHSHRVTKVGGSSSMTEQNSGRVTRDSELAEQLKINECNGTPTQKRALLNLLCEYDDVISRVSHDIGKTDIIEHEIVTETQQLIRQPPRRVGLTPLAAMKKQVNDWIEKGVVEESTSPWSSAVVPVLKKDVTIRFCIDFRKLNAVTVKNSYPIPRIDQTLYSLSGSTLFSSLDLVGGHLHVKVAEKDHPKTAFATPFGLYQFK